MITYNNNYNIYIYIYIYIYENMSKLNFKKSFKDTILKNIRIEFKISEEL